MMKVSALLLAQLLLATSAEARLFDKTRDVTRARETEEDTDRIINGVEAQEDRYPYMVSLQDDQGHFCGASLIATDIVLSAAHCAGKYIPWCTYCFCLLCLHEPGVCCSPSQSHIRICYSYSFPSQVVTMTPLLVGTGTTIKMETKYECLKNSFTRNIMNGPRTTTSWY